ncbi:hypothetical protein DFH27DRAFT_558760 [Peziza echinospora]|nr:hypothetical protein DFH27DRAFT_558760 [Peziza echinospora]
MRELVLASSCSLPICVRACVRACLPARLPPCFGQRRAPAEARPCGWVDGCSSSEAPQPSSRACLGTQQPQRQRAAEHRFPLSVPRPRRRVCVYACVRVCGRACWACGGRVCGWAAVSRLAPRHTHPHTLPHAAAAPTHAPITIALQHPGERRERGSVWGEARTMGCMPPCMPLALALALAHSLLLAERTRAGGQAASTQGGRGGHGDGDGGAGLEARGGG